MIGIWFGNMFNLALTGAAVFAVARVLYLNIVASKKLRDMNWAREAVLTLFVGFLVSLAGVTLDVPELILNGLSIDARDVNLVPFKQISGYIRWAEISDWEINLLGNIFVFSPIGFFVPLLRKYKHPFLAGAAATAAVSVFVELFQLLSPRTTDIDDIILNAVGGVVGAALYLVFAKLFPKADAAVKRRDMDDVA